MKGGRVEGEKVRSSKMRLKASKPGVSTNSHELSSNRHFDEFAADSIHLKKPSVGPKGLIGPPCHGAPGRRRQKGEKMEDKDSLAAQILDTDALGLIELYKKRKIKPSEAVEFYIQHQERFNSKLNLVVEKRYKECRQEAVRYDALLEKGEVKGKLFGVPMSIKESFDIAGMHTTGSLRHNKNRLIQKDGEIVKRFRSEGAIILNKTNAPSLCFCQETDNNLFGCSNVFGLPAIVIPCGRSQDGLPIGLQVVSTVGNESLVFQVASFLESSFGGYRRNQSYDSAQG
jgi:Asp-tRNA(Asn)/Glu-tRNA(Gln) amidotransferase A subunit family amidase